MAVLDPALRFGIVLFNFVDEKSSCISELSTPNLERNLAAKKTPKKQLILTFLDNFAHKVRAAKKVRDWLKQLCWMVFDH